MNEIKRVALLTDNRTSRLGRQFMKNLKSALEECGKEAFLVEIDNRKSNFEVMQDYDQIPVVIKPDLLIVSDFACILMKSAEEEPLYNNISIPVIHLLFRRPWEYEEFMIFRCNFNNRCYCMLSEDAKYIRQFYKRLPNVRILPEGLWNKLNLECCYAGDSLEEAEKWYREAPNYLKQIGDLLRSWRNKNQNESPAEGMMTVLSQVGFECSEEEFLDIMFLMKQMIFLTEIQREESVSQSLPTVNTDKLADLVTDFLQTDFPVSLL